jgi:hypothetical protein
MTLASVPRRRGLPRDGLGNLPGPGTAAPPHTPGAAFGGMVVSEIGVSVILVN